MTAAAAEGTQVVGQGRASDAGGSIAATLILGGSWHCVVPAVLARLTLNVVFRLLLFCSVDLTGVSL